MVKIEDYATAREIISSEIDAFNEKNEDFEATWSYRENKQGGFFSIVVTYDDSYLLLSEHLIKHMDDSAVYDRFFINDDLRGLKKKLIYRVNMTLSYRMMGSYMLQD